MTKKLSAFAMALALFVCAALLPAPGAQAATAVTARLRPDVTIVKEWITIDTTVKQ